LAPLTEHPLEDPAMAIFGRVATALLLLAVLGGCAKYVAYQPVFEFPDGPDRFTDARVEVAVVTREEHETFLRGISTDYYWEVGPNGIVNRPNRLIKGLDDDRRLVSLNSSEVKQEPEILAPRFTALHENGRAKWRQQRKQKNTPSMYMVVVAIPPSRAANVDGSLIWASTPLDANVEKPVAKSKSPKLYVSLRLTRGQVVQLTPVAGDS